MKSGYIENMDFKTVLKREANKINIELTNEMLEKFEIYKNLLIDWNEKINLTAITEDYEVIMKHYIDCLEITKYISKGNKIIDIGTGAGFPGIVISIFFGDDIELTLLDALNKRLIFLEEVRKKLNLKNIKIVHGRAEELAHKEGYRESYDVVVSRAVSNLSTLLEYDIAYIKVGGRCLFLKGDNVNIEINESKKAFDKLKCSIVKLYQYQYSIKEEIYHRYILDILKDEITPKIYPRNNVQIKKNPLK